MKSQQRSETAPQSSYAGGQRLPLGALLALATAVFVTSLTETLPAGLLLGMSADLGVGEAAVGQTVTAYAAGTALTAVPLTAATAALSRKRLLAAAMAGFAVANTVTALSTSYPLTMVARFAAGVAAGLAWALLAGYARRIAPAHLQGRAVAVAMAGIPVALSLGVPAGTFLGEAVGWRAAFWGVTAVTVGLLGWLAAAVPDVPGTPAAGRESAEGRAPMFAVLRVPGVAAVLAVTAVFVLAHTALYAYVAAYLERLGMGGATGPVLLVFGGASLVSLWAVGAYVHGRLRALTLASTLLVTVAAAVLAVVGDSPPLVYAAAVLWGLGWGGVPTLLQTAAADAAGDAVDAAQALLVTLWNAAMAAGGALGGVLLERAGTAALPWTVAVLLVPVLAVVGAARAHGFPHA
ncbi:MFS transporter [Streptomyces sp. NPDC020412]|uniref:MFS transporter n=1 Tax=Streptomyces sp. NPDC020412 TaxID=3365073 RepID=UPI0037B9ABBE